MSAAFTCRNPPSSSTMAWPVGACSNVSRFRSSDSFRVCSAARASVTSWASPRPAAIPPVAWAGGPLGRWICTVVPSCSRPLMVRVPWCASTMFLVILSPRPTPGMPASPVFGVRKNAVPTCGSESASIPIPVSLTITSMPSPPCQSAHGDSTAGGSELDRVGQHVVENLQESTGICGDHEFGWEVPDHGQAGVGRALIDLVETQVGECGDIGRSHVQPHAPVLHLAHGK